MFISGPAQNTKPMNDLQLIYDIATNLSDALLCLGFLTDLGLLYVHREL